MRHQIIFGTSVINNEPPTVKDPTVFFPGRAMTSLAAPCYPCLSPRLSGILYPDLTPVVNAVLHKSAAAMRDMINSTQGIATLLC